MPRSGRSASPTRGAHKFPPRRKIIEQCPSTEAEELALALKSSRGSYGDGIEDTALISDDGTGNFGYANAGEDLAGARSRGARIPRSRDLHSCRDHGRAIDAFAGLTGVRSSRIVDVQPARSTLERLS